MRVYCIKHDNQMKVAQASITSDYEVLIHFECSVEGCENKINIILDSKHTSNIVRDGVEQM